MTLTFKKFMDINNREIASIFWFSVLCFWVLFFSKAKSDIRFQLCGIAKIFFERQIRTTTIIFAVYIVCIVCICFLLNVWDKSLLKETILWALVAYSNIFKIAGEGDFREKMKSIALRCFTLSFFVEYIANMTSFNLIAELIIAPIVTVIALMAIIAEYDEKNAIIKKPLNYLLVAWGIFILSYSAYSILNNESMNLAIESKKFTLPFILTALFTPFPYMFFLYCQYERLYVPIVHNVKNKKEAFRIVYRIFKAFKLNLFALEEWQANVHPYHLRSVDDVESRLKIESE